MICVMASVIIGAVLFRRSFDLSVFNAFYELYWHDHWSIEKHGEMFQLEDHI